MCWIKYILVLFSVVLGEVMMGQASEFPALTGHVVDEIGILSNSQKLQIEKILTSDEENQVFLVLLQSLRGQEIEEYSNALFRYWGVGDKTKNNGVLIAIAPHERQARIEVGYGLESVLTDAQSAEIMRQDIIPYAKKGNYAMAALKGAAAVISVLKGESISQPQKNNSYLLKLFLVSIFFLIWGIVMIKHLYSLILYPIWMKMKGKYGSHKALLFLLIGLFGIIMFIILCFRFHFLMLLLFISILIIGLMNKNTSFEYSYRKTHRRGRVSGGGGSSGGGGASGRW